MKRIAVVLLVWDASIALVGELLMRLSTVRVALVSVKMFCGA